MRVACCQMTSTPDPAANLDAAERLVHEAAGAGARLVCLPEYFACTGSPAEWKRVAREVTPAVLTRMGALAKRLRIFLLLGSVIEEVPGSPKCANTSVLLSPDGREIGRYRKRHLFDVNLPNGRRRESEVLVAGDAPVVCEAAGWRVGFSICYDIRFPDHYQALRRLGAELILAPSAFTTLTGRAHWRPLLRARAIETQCYLAAAAQVGECGFSGACHGHAMIVDPWGAVLADAGDAPGMIVADLDRAFLADVRRRMPLFPREEGPA